MEKSGNAVPKDTIQKLPERFLVPPRYYMHALTVDAFAQGRQRDRPCLQA